MHKRPTYQQLQQGVKDLEREVAELKKTNNFLKKGTTLCAANLDETDESLRKELHKRRKLEATLTKGKKRYEFLYDFSPIGFTESDWSSVKSHIETLREAGITDFRSYFENHPKDVAQCAAKVKILNVNKTMIDIFKARNKTEFLANLEKTLVDESYENFREKLIAYAEGKDSAEARIVGKTFKGENRYFALKWSFVPAVKEQRTRMLDALVDITNLHRTEEELRKFKTISDNTTVGNAIVDLQGAFTYVNRAFARMHGYSVKGLVGKHFSILHTKEQLKELEKLDRELRENGTLENAEVWRLRKDGTLFPTLTNATIYRDKRGAGLFISLTAIDITERKQIEREVEIKSRDLEEATITLRVLTGNVQKERVELKQKVAQTISSVLKTSLEKLKKSGLTEQQKSYVAALESNLSSSMVPAAEALSSRFPNLSPSEILIATLVRDGKNTPEIARMLDLSQRTIDVHRRHIRKKLGIKKQKVNLQTFLLSIQ